MSTFTQNNDGVPKIITDLPYNDAGTPGEAVERFLANWTRVVNPASTNGTSTPELHKQVISMIGGFVRGCFYRLSDGDAYGNCIEIELMFEQADDLGSYRLCGPKPLVGCLEHCFRSGNSPIRVELVHTDPFMSRRGSKYVLCITPTLVTFAGMVVWQAPE